MKRIDLHVHTTASDGTCAPGEAVRLAKEKGLAAIAVTDHDTADAYAPTAAAAEGTGLEIVPGIEISTRYFGSVHILGYFIDPQSDELRPVLDWVVRDRDERNRKMVELMAADGLPVSYEKMHERFGAVVGRPHFARVLYELGLAESVPDAFERYVQKGRKYYVGRQFLPIERSVEIIRLAGGVPVLAHPFQYRLEEAQLRELIEEEDLPEVFSPFESRANGPWNGTPPTNEEAEDKDIDRDLQAELEAKFNELFGPPTTVREIAIAKRRRKTT